MVLLCICCISCARQDVNVLSVEPQAFVTESGRMGVSLWFLVDGYKDTRTLELHSPDGIFAWNLNVDSTVYNGQEYIGSSNAVMPLGLALPEGQWSYTLVFRDGRTEEGIFEIPYRDVDGALERALGQKLPCFDPVSNLTVISDIPSNSMIQLGL